MTVGLYEQSLYDQALFSSGTVTTEPPPPAPPPPPGKPWLTDRVEWHPPTGEPLTFWRHRTRPHWTGMLLVDPSGLSGMPRQHHSMAGPGQWGATPTGAQVPDRSEPLVVAVFGADAEDRARLVADLERACFTEPGEPRPGWLRVFRHGRPAVETVAFPDGQAGREISRGNRTRSTHAVDFWLPNPLWRSVQSHALFFGGVLGGEFVLDGDTEHVLDGDTEHVLSGNVALEVVYEGVAPAPVTIDFHGEMDGPRLVVEGPDGRVEEVALDVELDAGERLVVSTGRGQVQARLFTGGEWVDGADAIDNVVTRPWLLRRGLQTVSLAATVNTSGTARLAWHDWFPAP